MEFKYYSIKEIQNFLTLNNLRAHKMFGQHFLINAGVVQTIILNINRSDSNSIVEIGCGLGSLTNKLVATGLPVVGFEIDTAYISHLKNLFGSYSNFSLIEGDFLKHFDKLQALLPEGAKPVIAGNLPYNITTPILEKVITSEIPFTSLIFMMQKEVGERICAEPGSKKFGSLSVYCQYYTEPERIATVSARSFYPPPRVDSIVISFKKRPYPIRAHDEQLFFKVVRSLFMSRRKQIKNTLTGSPLLSFAGKETILAALEETGIKVTERGENLEIKTIIELANNLKSLLS